MTEDELELLNDLYDNCLFHLDSEIRKLYFQLKSDGLLENTVFIVTADHGEMLGEEGKISHQCCFRDEILRVPLIIHHPQLKPEIVHDQTETKNIFSMILKMSKCSYNNFYSRSDFAFGQWKASPHVQKEIKKIDPDYFTSAEYLRTNHLKLVKLSNGESELYSLKNGEEKLQDNNLKSLMEKEMEIKQNRVGGIL